MIFDYFDKSKMNFFSYVYYDRRRIRRQVIIYKSDKRIFLQAKRVAICNKKITVYQNYFKAPFLKMTFSKHDDFGVN